MQGGQVVLSMFNRNSSYYALKQFYNTAIVEKQNVDGVRSEISLSLRLKNPFIIYA